MATLRKYDLSGKEVGTVNIDDALLEATAHSQSIKDYIVALRHNARQWSANTKRRGEVNHTGRKPHPQKGQGRSRQGDLAAPHYKGGGVVWGPRPKFDVNVRINRKEERAAICFMIADKIKKNQIHVLQNDSLEQPKTKSVAEFLNKHSLLKRRLLLLGSAESTTDTTQANFVKSLRNIPKKEFMLVPQVNGYELARSQEIIVLESAIQELISLFGLGR